MNLFDEIFAHLPVYLHKVEGAFFMWLWFKEAKITSEQLYQKLKEQEYYEMRKEVLGAKTASVVKKYECSVTKIKYQQIKAEFERQQRSWNLMVRRYA